MTRRIFFGKEAAEQRRRNCFLYNSCRNYRNNYFSVRSFNKKGDDYSYSQFVQDLNDGIVSCVTIKQNEQAPTGKITVDFSQQGKESVSTYVTDVNMVEKL